MEMRILDSSDTDFWHSLELAHGASDGGADAKVMTVVQEILADVRKRGDEALMEYTARFDRLQVQSPADLEIPRERLKAALKRVSVEQRHTLEFSAERIRRYHEHQTLKSWAYLEDDGTVLGQKVTPLDRVGL
ncbi:MAG: histidinol dehydrogenase, partial [Gammaproteobacteria bacterium]|nr:histidinol dehydrogenase [Gammaproteobacteria bacterium]